MTFNLYWVAEDKQSDMAMGEFSTLEEAQAGQPEAAAEIISQGGTDEGYWMIDERDEDGDTVRTYKRKTVCGEVTWWEM